MDSHDLTCDQAAQTGARIREAMIYIGSVRNTGFTKLTKGGKRRGRPPGSPNKSANPSRSTANGYEAIEERLDEVIRLLWDLGDHDLVAEFRVARRKIAAKLA